MRGQLAQSKAKVLDGSSEPEEVCLELPQLSRLTIVILPARVVVDSDCGGGYPSVGYARPNQSAKATNILSIHMARIILPYD